jgi:hypothetical protein
MLDIFNHFMPDSIFNRLEKLVPGHVALKAFPERPSLLDLSSRLKIQHVFSKTLRGFLFEYFFPKAQFNGTICTN